MHAIMIVSKVMLEQSVCTLGSTSCIQSLGVRAFGRDTLFLSFSLIENQIDRVMVKKGL